MSTSTFDQYVSNFRDELQTAGKECLASLELKIKDEGDDWLEAHLESLFSASASHGPFVEHLKTPSRTATVKRTRAKLEAEKQRTDKIKSVNARLALGESPRSLNASPARLLFQQSTNSPLQPRTMNAVSPSPIKAAKSKSQVGSGRSTPKGKGRMDENQTNTAAAPTPKRLVQARSPPQPQPQQQSTTRQAFELGSPITRSTAARGAALSPAQSPTRPAKSPLRQATSPEARSPVPKRTRPQSPTPVLPSTSAQPQRFSNSSLSSNSGGIFRNAPTAHKDLSMIMEGESERSSTRVKSPIRAAAKSPTQLRPQSPRANARPASPRSQTRQGGPSQQQQQQQQPSIDSILAPAPSTSFAVQQVQAASASTTTPVAAAPAVPVRAVRSSWLSKAIASGAVPVHQSATDARKSVVAQARPTLHTDFAGLRKSLVPPNGLKRKSEEGAEDDEPTRPGKITKVEAPVTEAPPPPVPSRPIFERQPSHPSTATQAPPPAPISVSAPAPPSAAEVDVETPADILKVTKALEEMKQRTQAKELAKQKAATAAAAQASARPQATTTTGGGFFKGLTKSLGLGGRTESPEEEAERLQRELEEDRRAEAEAQAELDRLMQDDKRESEVTPEPEQEVLESTTPAVSPPEIEEVHPSSDKTEEEEEEFEVIEALSFAEDAASPVKVQPSQPSQPQQSALTSDQVLAPPKLATPPRISDFRMSTTPAVTPPRKLQPQHTSRNMVPALHDRAEKHERSTPAKQPKLVAAVEIATRVSTTPAGEPRRKDSVGSNTADEEDEEEETEKTGVTEHVKRVILTKQTSTQGTVRSSASTSSMAPLAPSNHALLNQASTIAAKTLGVKPVVAPVKSVQLAQAAAKKEQDAAGRMQKLREAAEARRQEAERKKAEEERASKLEAERIRRQELERGQKLRAELDRKKAERDAQMAQSMKQQAERQQKEAAAAKAKAAEDEANRKRKMAPTLNKSTTANPAKRAAPGPSGGSTQTQANKARETFRPTSSVKGNPQPTNHNQAKLGPTSFRTAPANPAEQQQSTIRLVSANPAHLGPPSRASGMPNAVHSGHPHPQWAHVPTNTQAPNVAGPGPSGLLQQHRAALQHQLEDKALEAQSEDIVLPDIASEYSDSNDSEKSNEFKRPEWAESPELRAALERQATRNPDELFGPIKPISMEELFKVKVSKFRPRSSSANWASGDGVTRKEELEYARRMGFKNPKGEGSSNNNVL